MESYPAEFAHNVQMMADAASSAAAASGSGGDGADDFSAQVDSLYGELVGAGLLDEGPCQQIKDMATSAATLASCEVFGADDADAARQSLDDAFNPQPDAVTEELWKRTRSLCETAGRWKCKEANGDEDGAKVDKKACKRHARFLGGFGPGKSPSDPEEFASRAAQTMPGTVIMFSGCRDSQTSADVYNTASFGLPEDAGPGGAGGACTSSMIKALSEKDDYSWIDLLKAMRQILSEGSYTQVPMLSASREVDLNGPFSVAHDDPNGNYRALMVGINYVGSSCELKGCWNDVETMKRYLLDKGYTEDCMKILLDDGDHDEPNYENITAAMTWLVEGAQAGDTLFFHYSGHGASVADDDGDEKDGKDECLCPCDYNSAGLLRDDDVFKLLVGPLGEGVKLTCVLDCCHSGTILDLPYRFTMDSDDAEPVMQQNPDFDFGKIMQVIQDHPAACAAAAVCAGVAYACMGDEKREQVGGMLMGMAKSFF